MPILLKRLLVSTAALIMVGGLAACSGSDSTTVGSDGGDNTGGSGGGTGGGDTGGGAGTGGGDTGGGDNNGGGSANTDSRTLTLSMTASTATETNLIGNGQAWTRFDGAASGITQDGTGLITVPAPVAPETNRVGVREVQTALDASTVYSLTVESENPNFAAVIYLLTEYGAILPFTDMNTGATHDWIAARPGSTLRFEAPLNVASFYVSLQNDFDIALAERTRTNIDVANNAPEPTLPVTAQGDYLPEGFSTMLFSEEFDGTELDRNKWCTRLPYGSGPALQIPDAECTKWIGQGTLDFANEVENQRFRDVNKLGENLHVVSNGTIKLRATQTDLSRQYQNFEAGALRSKQKFPADPAIKYYFTAKVKMPNVRGSWPAFFLNPDLDPNGVGTTPPEIDILEGALNEVEDTQFSATQHAQVNGAQTSTGEPDFTFTANGFNPAFGSWQSPVTLRDRWIQVGAEWDQKGVCYYIEGFRTACENYKWVTRDGTPGNPATILTYLAVGGDWAGRHGIDEASFPIHFEVDYIRVYTKPYVAD